MVITAFPSDVLIPFRIFFSCDHAFPLNIITIVRRSNLWNAPSSILEFTFAVHFGVLKTINITITEAAKLHIVLGHSTVFKFEFHIHSATLLHFELNLVLHSEFVAIVFSISDFYCILKFLPIFLSLVFYHDVLAIVPVVFHEVFVPFEEIPISW